MSFPSVVWEKNQADPNESHISISVHKQKAHDCKKRLLLGPYIWEWMWDIVFFDDRAVVLVSTVIKTN